MQTCACECTFLVELDLPFPVLTSLALLPLNTTCTGAAGVSRVSSGVSGDLEKEIGVGERTSGSAGWGVGGEGGFEVVCVTSDVIVGQQQLVVSLCLYVTLSVCFFFFVCACLSFPVLFLFLSVSVCLSVSVVSVTFCLCLRVCLSICLSVCLSFSLRLCPSVCLVSLPPRSLPSRSHALT